MPKIDLKDVCLQKDETLIYFKMSENCFMPKKTKSAKCK